jgi:ABC-2 type transport system ATP-binding protein
VDVETRNQLVSLIRSLADNGAAVVYSTHYLSEVEQLDVSTVAILVEGEIVASDSIPNLVSARGGASVELRFDGEPPALNLPEGTVLVGEDRLRVPAVESPAITAVSLLQALNGDAHAVREIKLIQPSLESVFLSITSKGSTVGEGAAAP